MITAAGALFIHFIKPQRPEMTKGGFAFMNLRVRLKNPVFWMQLLLGISATMLTYASLTASDMTSWGAVFDVARKALTTLTACLWLRPTSGAHSTTRLPAV